MTMTEFLDWAVLAGFAMVFAAAGLALLRLALGPTLADRVVALRSGDGAFLDVALVLALVGFLATVALARFAERQVIRQRKREEAE